jgi:GxxExxY protein
MLHGILTGKIIDCAMRVHSAFGPGLFEEVYKISLLHELAKSGLTVVSEVSVPLSYGTIQLPIGFRMDIVVNDSIVVELKSVLQLLPIHKSQLLTYLKLAKKEVGILLNFNTAHLKNGIIRIVNTSKSNLPPFL